ncbi:PQQ-dependent sugar dehydrogenase [Entomohabitans teleogrylli]|uniref:PQQ-dependent sugar dehydrogenase n=1 Tax=Entomohabitans teleogrylli TaxID=1384589 RepID=UPI00073D9E2A|nr:PQQ-dependent sugar dehydrogenase [Entomohabitans teleogrylli]
MPARFPRWLIVLLPLWFTFAANAQSINSEVLQQGLDHPWSLAFLPENQGMLITLRGGELRLWQEGKALSGPISGVPQVWARGQGGLMDVVLAPDFASSRRVWLSFSEAGADGKAGTAVGYGTLSDDRRQLTRFTVVFRQQPKLSDGNHFGGRMAFDNQGYLYITLGENNRRTTAQDNDKLQGKVVRLTAQGRVPEDNPFYGQPGARPEIWTLGHRNPQGLALNPWTGEMWLNEHGPRGGDEINVLAPGKNYGWPLATHGVNYSGLPIPEAQGEQVAGTEPPRYVWKVSPAISGMAFYNSKRFPAWQNKLFIGALKEKEVIALTVQGDRVGDEQRLLGDLQARIRDVRVGPDGFLYLLTDERNGKLVRAGPQP